MSLVSMSLAMNDIPYGSTCSFVRNRARGGSHHSLLQNVFCYGMDARLWEQLQNRHPMLIALLNSRHDICHGCEQERRRYSTIPIMKGKYSKRFAKSH